MKVFNIKKDEIKGTYHSKYRCQYHIILVPKYKRDYTYKCFKADIGQILRDLCSEKNVGIIEAQACKNYIHMLINIPIHLNILKFISFLKSKSTIIIFDKYINSTYKCGKRNFWCKGYYVDTVELNKNIVKEYTKNQLEDDCIKDYLAEQIPIEEYMKLFEDKLN